MIRVDQSQWLIELVGRKSNEGGEWPNVEHGDGFIRPVRPLVATVRH